MLQEAILKGEAVYVRHFIRRQDIRIEDVRVARERLNNKLKGLKLDQAIASYADHPKGVYNI